jgi:hypothetical protein
MIDQQALPGHETAQALVGGALYAAYRPDGTSAAAAVVIATLALAIIGLGILIVVARSSIPGLMPPMQRHQGERR